MKFYSVKSSLHNFEGNVQRTIKAHASSAWALPIRALFENVFINREHRIAHKLALKAVAYNIFFNHHLIARAHCIQNDLFTFKNSLTYARVIISKFEITSRVAPAANHFNSKQHTANSTFLIMMLIKHHNDHLFYSCCCLFFMACVEGPRCASSLAVGYCQKLFRGTAYGNQMCERENVKLH